MKRLIPATILLVFIITVSLIGKFTIESNCKKTINELKSCYREIRINNTDNALKYAKKAKKEWKNKSTAVSLFSNRRLTDEIVLGLTHLCGYLETEDISGAIHEYKTVISAAEKIIGEQNLTIDSFC